MSGARHVVELRPGGWTIQHPVACRPDLFACPVNRAAERWLTPTWHDAPGRFYLDLVGDLPVVGEPVAAADAPPRRPDPALVELPWAEPWQPRCRAAREPRPDASFHGRCGLRRGHSGDHALERGLVIPRWSTDWTDG